MVAISFSCSLSLSVYLFNFSEGPLFIHIIYPNYKKNAIMMKSIKEEDYGQIWRGRECDETYEFKSKKLEDYLILDFKEDLVTQLAVGLFYVCVLVNMYGALVRLQ